MMQKEKNYCFCTLALGKEYRTYAKTLAHDLEKHAPGKKIIVLTDLPSEFNKLNNAICFKWKQKSIWRAVHDKRFAIKKALELFPIAVFIDSDSRVFSQFPDEICVNPGITCRSTYYDLQHSILKGKYDSKIIKYKKKLESYLNINFNKSVSILETFYIIRRDSGREKIFIETWDVIERFLYLHKIGVVDGFIMGLSACRAGWKAQYSKEYEELCKKVQHLGTNYKRKNKKSFLTDIRKYMQFRFRLTKAWTLGFKNPGLFFCK